jgi:hypothetical protein
MPTLKELYNEDQSERIDHPLVGTPEYTALRLRDHDRREQARSIIAGSDSLDGEELYCAAMIFQHSDELDDIDLARQLALGSVELGYEPARWLAAASLDRWLMYQGLPQKYGTNIVPDGRRQRVWETDPATTDEERARWNVPTMAEMIARAEEITRTEPMPPMEDAPEWLKGALDRWRESDR